MFHLAMTLCERVLAATSAREASLSLHHSAATIGAVSLQTRLYHRPAARLTSASHWAAGGFVVREAPDGWVGSAGFRYICFDQNPLLEPIRLGLTRYRFSDFAPHADTRFGRYWEAFSEAGIADGLCASAYGPDRRIASVHLGIGGRDLDEEVREALSIATGVLAERLMTFPADHEPCPATALSARERDAMIYVAQGKTDWEISSIFGVAESTARFHVDNARRKLGAVNRPHAVACFIAANGPF